MKKATFLFIGLSAISILSAQNIQYDGKVEVIPCAHFGISRPLSDLFEENNSEESETTEDKDIIREESKDREHRTPQVFKYTAEDGEEYGEDARVRQTIMGNRQPLAPLQNWLGQTGNGTPPDPTGAAGTNYYVQAVNATPFKVFNKTTGAIVGTVRNIGSLWSPATTNDGDPIVLYDKYADRWFLSQFKLANSGTTANPLYNIYIAISTTNNPTGTYYTYTFTSQYQPDYLKFSVWADGYYMSSNSTGLIFCFERDKMILGNASARSIVKTYTLNSSGNVSGFFLPLPADADGVLPPFGTPCPFFAYSENSWGGGAIDGIKIWNMSVNWATTPTATLTGPTVITTAAFDGTYNNSWNDIPQPGVTSKLDGIGGVCNFRSQWRKWTGYNSVVLTWGVKISSTQRSVRWVELHQDQTTNVWTVYQQSTYAPDAYSRWVGSIAMDDNGSIALCYAKSGPTSVTPNVSPSLAYTGRLATDPLGTMSFAETIAGAGSGAQTNTNRFGDYSQTSIDPDGITFWHTGEYLVSGAQRTRIYSFRLPLTVGVVEHLASETNIYTYQSANNLIVKANSLPNDDELNVDLFDAVGQQIISKKVTPNSNELETSFDVSTVAKGTYMVRIGKLNSSFQKVTKLVIN